MKHLNSNYVSIKVILSVTLLSIIFQLNAQDEQMKNLAQFLFPEFAKSVVKMKVDKNILLMLNYNIVTERMVFLQRGQAYDLITHQNVDTIIMNNCKFVPVDSVFHEVLLADDVNLFLQHKGQIQEPGKPSAYGGTSQVSSSNYITRFAFVGSNQYFNTRLPGELIVKAENIYWISFKDKKYHFENMRQFLKIFPGKENEIKKYIKLNHLEFENEEDVKKIASYSYSLLK